jgi:hypothetical protein
MACAFALLLALSAHALPVVEEDFEAFLKSSQANPKQLHVLKLSATWCGPCKQQSAALSSIPEGTKSAVARAHWNEVQVDKLPSGVFEGFIL